MDRIPFVIQCKHGKTHLSHFYVLKEQRQGDSKKSRFGEHNSIIL